MGVSLGERSKKRVSVPVPDAQVSVGQGGKYSRTETKFPWTAEKQKEEPPLVVNFKCNNVRENDFNKIDKQKIDQQTNDQKFNEQRLNDQQINDQPQNDQKMEMDPVKIGDSQKSILRKIKNKKIRDKFKAKQKIRNLVKTTENEIRFLDHT